MMFVLGVLVVGCGGTPATSPPPSAAAEPSQRSFAPPLASFGVRASLDPDVCEIAIRTANHMQSVLLEAADALGTPAMDELVDETADLAEAQRRLIEDETHPTLVTWTAMLAAVDDSVVGHLTGDDVPFIDAVGAAALYANDLKAACS